MLGRATFMLAILTLTSFAGCISKGAEETPPTVQTSNTDGVLDANESARAPDGRGDIAAFQETNRTEMGGTGGMVHEHDYWMGKERLENVAWIDAGLIPIPLLPCKKEGGGCTAGGTTPNSDTYPPLTTIADFDLAPPPAMGMIYEGTKQVELKMIEITGPCRNTPAGRHCTEPNPAGKVYFDYLAANDEAGVFRPGGELKLNEPFLIDIEPTDADMPHQTKSLWIFRIYSNSEMVWFDFNITINLVKGYDVVDWPPHPDLYAERAERTVFDAPVHLESKGSVDAFTFGSDAGWTRPERVISWNTDRVDITISDVTFTGQIPVPPSGFWLEYRNASTPFLMANGVAYGGRLEDPGSDGSTYTFSIDLREDRGDAYDTPYAQHSRWGFRLVPYWEDSATGGGCIDEVFFPGILFGCQWYPWSMDYKMLVKSTGRPLDPAAEPGAIA